MTRPTQEDVDEALALGVPSPYSADVAKHYAVLAAEVLALREELAAQTELATLHKLDAAKLREEVASLERVRLQEAFAIAPEYFRKHVPGYDAIMATATYSTEAVDALLRLDADARWHRGSASERLEVEGEMFHAMHAVRASREPPLAMQQELDKTLADSMAIINSNPKLK